MDGYLEIHPCPTGHRPFGVAAKKAYHLVCRIMQKRKQTTVGPRNNSPAFKGSPSIKVNILRSQMIVFNVILPLFKGNPEIKVKNLQSQWDR